MYIGGLDIGTTGCKIVLFDECGRQVKTAYREYNIKRNRGFHEVDIDAVYSSVKEVLKETAEFDVGAVGVTSFGETFVILDECDLPLAPSMLYTDPRGKDECEDIINRFGAKELALKTGAMPHEMYSVSKLMWIKNNMPYVFEKAKHILLMQDFIVYMLTGVCQIDYSLAARTGAFDIKKKQWIDEIFIYCGIDKKLMSEPVPSGTSAGKIRPQAAKELGISENITIVSGCQDQIAALAGANVLENGRAMDGIGTVECVPVIMDDVPEDLYIYSCGYSIVPHINGKYACYVLSYAGGASLKWFRDNISNVSYDEMNKKVSEKPTDLLIMPHFAGAATPYMDTGSRAAVFGLTFEHDIWDIYKALMEGTSYEIMLNLQKLCNLGINISQIMATGGGSNSDVWLQIKADVFGAEISVLDTAEVGAAGTAQIAGKAIGVYGDDIRLAKVKKTFYPNFEKHFYYLKQLEKYKKIYNASKEVICGE